MRVRGLATVGLVAAGALALPVAAPAAVTSSTRVPHPGRITATVFRISFPLPRGAHAPHELTISPLDRARMPRGVAVVATAQLLVDSPQGTAVYAGLVAAYRSRTVDPGPPRTDREPIRWKLETDSDPISDDSIELIEAPVGFWRPLDAPGPSDFESAPSALSGNDIFNDGHALSWSRERVPAATPDTDAAAGSTSESMISGRLDPG